MLARVFAFFVPPIALSGLILLGLGVVTDARAAQTGRRNLDATATTITERSQRPDARFSLEVRGLGLTIDRYRQHRVWEAIDARNEPHQSALSQSPNDYQWSTMNRSQDYDKRAADAFESALNGWVERWPIPVLVAGPANHMQPASHIGISRQQGGMAIHLFTVLDQRKGEGADALVNELFDFFDSHPHLPAAILFSADGLDLRPGRQRDEYFVPDVFDSVVALLVTRSDRVDRDIRPFTVEVPYDINLEDTEYDVIRLWNDYWDADSDYGNLPDNHSTMPWQFWHERQQKLMARIDPNGAQGTLAPFWKRTSGFKPNPWVPVRWTKWQMEEYDNAPLLGYLHRPVEVPLDAPAGPKGDHARAAAMAEGWKQALDTLPEGTAPKRLFYDTAGEGRRIVPLALAMNAEANPHPLAIDDPANSYDLTRRLGNTGVSSPFVQLALALMRSYHHGGASRIHSSIRTRPGSERGRHAGGFRRLGVLIAGP